MTEAEPDGGDEAPSGVVARVRGAVARVPRPVLAAGALLLVVGAGWWAFGRGDGGPGEAPRATVEAGEPEAVTACGLVLADELESIYGQGFEPASEEATEGVCELIGEDGVSRLSFLLTPTPDPAAFRALVADPSARPVPRIGDEAYLWTTSTGGVVAARAGGQGIVITYVGDPLAVPAGPDVERDEEDPEAEADPPPDQATIDAAVGSRLQRLAEVVLARVLPTDFAPVEGPDVARETCGRIDKVELAGALEVDADTASLVPLGVSGCSFTTPEGTNLSVEVLDTAYTADQLDGLGVEVVQDGETFSSSPVPVEGLGDHAVWLADPVSPLSGELYALYGETVVRVTSAGVDGEGPARQRAVVVMGLLGEELAG